MNSPHWQRGRAWSNHKSRIQPHRSNKPTAGTTCDVCRQSKGRIIVTTRGNLRAPDGTPTLIARIFCSNPCASQGGFPWAGTR